MNFFKLLGMICKRIHVKSVLGNSQVNVPAHLVLWTRDEIERLSCENTLLKQRVTMLERTQEKVESTLP